MSSGFPGLRDLAPPNVTFTGFLPSEEYERALLDADVIMTLTTEPSSIMRAAYEAVYARRPLIVTDWPLGRETVPLRRARPQRRRVHRRGDHGGPGTRSPHWSRMTDEARAVQLARWSTQIPQLRRMLQLPDHEGDGSSEGEGSNAGA